LLVAVKAGTAEGYIDDLLEFFDKRNPYDFEISNERIFAIGRKV